MGTSLCFPIISIILLSKAEVFSFIYVVQIPLLNSFYTVLIGSSSGTSLFPEDLSVPSWLRLRKVVCKYKELLIQLRSLASSLIKIRKWSPLSPWTITWSPHRHEWIHSWTCLSKRSRHQEAAARKCQESISSITFKWKSQISWKESKKTFEEIVQCLQGGTSSDFRQTDGADIKVRILMIRSP